MVFLLEKSVAGMICAVMCNRAEGGKRWSEYFVGVTEFKGALGNWGRDIAVPGDHGLSGMAGIVTLLKPFFS